MPKIVINTDGGARNNPGPAGAGFVIREGDHLLFEGKQYLGSQTNNWAEYEAVALALAQAKSLGLSDREVEVRMDSKLVVEQVMGNWKIKEPTLKPQLAKVKVLLGDFPGYQFVYVPRAENADADRLVNEAIDEGQGL
ncbi:MAG TPA: ribonuclease HI family protein [Candidatus Paceibacterota bacterium]|nr:ribonuclease HI family protein [Candidatus Paceibacterota bacterium]